MYPSDKEGVKGKIIRKYEAGFYDEQKEEMVVESLKKVVYTWTGKALKKDEVLVDKKYDINE